ncbi:uncharacterized protein LOC106137745 isoform X2 [Amyelois transitella]|uniref:uncharacterized protein LOC106137745 isoform X2 n=1 Tax=Amyelois transitella TaxID=680683 RepID=UPI00298F6226|nr:uncharacterized protein LOC106137745 isoform X2 [Amyelois transitella]
MCLGRSGGAWCAGLLLLAVARPPPARAQPAAVSTDNEVGWRVTVSAVSPDGSVAGGAALARLAAAALAARGVPAQASAPPAACAAPDAPACLDAMLRALADGELDAALVPAPATAAPSSPLLRDAGLEHLGVAAPPVRRACLTTRGVLRSILDLVDVDLARLYKLSADDLELISRFPCQNSDCESETYVPEQCHDDNIPCATVLTGDKIELDVMSRVVHEHGLYARVISLGMNLPVIAATIKDRNLVVCDRAPEFTQLANLTARTLGPPPCQDHCPAGRCRAHSNSCPFEPRQLLKFANARSLTRSATALRVLTRLWFDINEFRDLIVQAHLNGPAAAADAYLDAHPQAAPLGEVRTAVLIPVNTSREAFNARALVAAAALAEEDLMEAGIPSAAHFKAELSDDGCAAPHAYKYLTDALGTGEYGALSAVAGPACGAAWADASRLSPAHVLPVLAYTPQPAPAPPAASLALLAAGDSRDLSLAWGSVLRHFGWRRLAVLSEPATRASFDHSTLQVDVVVHIELSENADNHSDLINRWIDRVKAVNARILYVNLEDVRGVRAALCAGRAAGLTGPGGAVWLLPGAPPPHWLRPTINDMPACAVDQLAEAAEGHLSFAPEWLVAWRDGEHEQAVMISDDESARRSRWRRRWRARCEARGGRGAGGACVAADAHAALLYDVLRLWAAALDALLARLPAALDDLHQPELVRSLIENATTSDYVGLTGRFEWSSETGAHARVSPLVLQQWNNGTRRRVARWTRAGLAVEGAVRWRSKDGGAPDDGAERCTLQPLADLLHADCRTALVALAALLLAAAVGALAGLAVHCRRRAEQEYRARLAALDMRTISLKPGGLDRWEVPRERVVINRKLGTGAFGTVYGGHALLSEERGWTAVAVKTLKAGATTEEKLDFLSEAEAMKRFDHKNIVRLLGVVTKTEPVCTVMEFMLYGDLKNYLLARRHLAGVDCGEGAEEVSARRLTAMALDAARALSYLAQLRYVHRDVAARNCLVSAHRQVKLADFGMTRLVFENDYYRFSRKGMLPVRWMAPESLTLGVFSPASDVWSFGVLLYEIVTFGSLPFQGLSNSEVLARVKAGHTLELPPGLKPQLEGLIKSCWQQEHKARPSAAEVAAFLADWPRLLAPCLALPLDALPLDADADAAPPWRLRADIMESRWVSWAAPPSAGTDTTYLSSDDAPPRDCDAFLPTP